MFADKKEYSGFAQQTWGVLLSLCNCLFLVRLTAVELSAFMKSLGHSL